MITDVSLHEAQMFMKSVRNLVAEVGKAASNRMSTKVVKNEVGLKEIENT